MKPFDTGHFIHRLQQACAEHDWYAIEQLDAALAKLLQQPGQLDEADVTQLQAIYPQMLREIGRAMQQSEQELAQFMQQHEQRLAYAAVAGVEDEA